VVSPAAQFEGLDHVQVAAPPGCEAAARRFYGELLGLPEIPKPVPLAAAGGAWFACGAQELHIGVTKDFAPAAKAHPGLRLADTSALNELAERLREANLLVEPDEGLPGHSRFFTYDPWGNRLELLARHQP
jgi:catechol 2,3-dioxygenase-like lactoylglutathione lyase family enzyme